MHSNSAGVALQRTQSELLLAQSFFCLHLCPLAAQIKLLDLKIVSLLFITKATASKKLA
jgi:hypothetical protein